MNPVRYAELLAKQLVNAEKPVIVRSIQGSFYHRSFASIASTVAVHVVSEADCSLVIGSPEYLTIVPSHASVVNRLFAQHLGKQPQTRVAIPDPYIKTISPAVRRQRMQDALKKLSELMEDASICERDPSSALSFSCVTAEVLQNQGELLERHMLGEHEAFSPLGMDGRPCRR